MSNIANVVIAADATVKVGKKSFTIAEAIKHASAVYDTMWLMQEQMLDHYREIGTILLGLQALFADNRKAFGQYLAGTDLGSMSFQDRSDAMFLAANWTKVQKLNKDGALDTLGVSAIRKRIKAAEGKVSNGAGKRKMDQNVSPKGEGEAAPKAEAKAPKAEAKAPKVQNETELADLVWTLIADNGLDFAAFTKALMAKRKK
jgi:hypothetical protein